LIFAADFVNNDVALSSCVIYSITFIFTGDGVVEAVVAVGADVVGAVVAVGADVVGAVVVVGADVVGAVVVVGADVVGAGVDGSVGVEIEVGLFKNITIPIIPIKIPTTKYAVFAIYL
jgi:hypothetical protein